MIATAKPVIRKAFAALLLAALYMPLVAACDTDTSGGAPPTDASTTSTKPAAKHGPSFPECGGVTDETISRLTGISGVVATARNSVGCQWLVNGSISGPWFSFSWYRGSPIGRERKNEELSRSHVEDITIDGHAGFIAIARDVRLGDRLCDVGIQFNDDFFEWSVQFIRKPFPNPCDIVTELSRQTIAAVK
ncbi:DUF3558 domain-containing protein [Mycobacterium intermedium]|nr:DUF3558 domain-containing protein [Mycobacterium intermedium]MCV6962979.1 DUF3558 domain-containing protein [Mycobacterium intermedium]